MFSNLKIGTRLFAMAGITSAILLAIGLLALNALRRELRALDDTLVQSYAVTRVIDNARNTQGQLVEQWKEWKNLLIRGHDKDDFEKHFKGFQQHDSTVTAQLGQVRDSLSAMGYSVTLIDPMIAQHKELADTYRQELRKYDPTDIRSTQKVDAALRGLDRPLT